MAGRAAPERRPLEPALQAESLDFGFGDTRSPLDDGTAGPGIKPVIGLLARIGAGRVASGPSPTRAPTAR